LVVEIALGNADQWNAEIYQMLQEGKLCVVTAKFAGC
jgi:hypothetical protein